MDDEVVNKRSSGQRPKKRKRNCFYGNQHKPVSCEVDDANDNESINLSASARKLSSNPNTRKDSDFSGYTIIDKTILFTALEQWLCCYICHSKISLSSETVCGLLEKMEISCDSCGTLCTVRNSRMVGKQQKASDINRRFTFAMRSIGKGYAECSAFCGVMDMPHPVSQTTYNKINEIICDATHHVAEASMKRAVDEEKKLVGSSDITVSGDGTWKTRGHSSRFGVSTIIGGETGKALDRYVASSYCKGCESLKAFSSTEDFLERKTEHEKTCNKNHSGSSGQMEVSAMINMFSKSEEKYQVRYLNYVGDGDCKTFLALNTNNPYSSPITKIECVGHIQKRMGSRLRKLKNNFRGKKLSDKKPLSGKGRLTDVLIDQITTYYGNAIRKHSDNVKDMQRAIWAIWHHKRSNDDEKLHELCPDGKNSWCAYQKAVADGTQSAYKHKKSVPPAVMDCIKPIFKDLSHPDLLKRCLGGRTQNTNESLNAMIWKYCPKTSNSAKTIVDIAANMAVTHFNDGKQGTLSIMEQLKLTPGQKAVAFTVAADEARIKFAEKRALSYSLEARIAKRQSKKKEDERNMIKEGLVYAPGTF